jgi:hypothetical protein
MAVRRASWSGPRSTTLPSSPHAADLRVGRMFNDREHSPDRALELLDVLIDGQHQHLLHLSRAARSTATH